MNTIDSRLLASGVQRLLREIFNGPESGKSAWILNSTDRGLLDTLAGLSAEQASRQVIPHRSTLAGHVGHVRYSLELLNRWARGENPYTDADWTGSWRTQTVTEEEWSELQGSLAGEVDSAVAMLDVPREWDAATVTGMIAAAAHSAYHFGAIRQVLGHLEE